jgi:hypothetical protein
MLKEHKSLLDGYKEVKPTQLKNIQVGDCIRYIVDQELRKGGFVKFVKYPDYIVLVNYGKGVSWSLQLKQPSLHVWIKTKASMQKERDEMKRIYQEYKNGNLVLGNLTEKERKIKKTSASTKISEKN